MAFIDQGELTFGHKGGAAKAMAGLLMRVLRLDRVNEVHDRAAKAQGHELEALIAELGLRYEVNPYDLKNIPATGPVIIVSNHPTGAPDGIVLIDILSRIRPDVRFMGNFLLNRIEFMKQYFIAVDPFDTTAKGRNISGIRESKRHLEQGGALVVFPAGEVATWQKGKRGVRDKQWSPSVLKFIRIAQVPVVPIHIEAKNSLGFHLAGKIHPMLRTALLPRQMLNKKKQVMVVNIASALSPKRAAELEDPGVYGDFLRANVEYLSPKRPRKRIIPKRKPAPKNPEEIILPVDKEVLQGELDAIRVEHLLFEYGDMEVYFARAADIPNMIREIGRLREVTFREIGEGSLKSIDTDRYDAYYRQLFIWNRAERELVGAYRMGMGDGIMEQYGLKGFYTDSLFRMDEPMGPIMAQTIELGRSFIVSGYQKKPASLMLLWKGILYVLLKHDQFRNLLGPVTISGEFEPNSKVIIVDFLRRNHLNKTLAGYIRPVTGMKGIRSTIDLSLVAKIDNIELINKLVTDIERDEFTVPVLVRKYLQLSSHVLAFNVDHDFNDALDALMLLDLKHMPESTISMLSKEITDIDVVARFRNLQ